MANEFACTDCGRDGTRCDCHTRRRPVHRKSEEEIIKEKESEVLSLLRQLDELRRQGRG